MNQIYYIGKNALRDWQKDLTALSVQRVFLVHGKQSYEACGAKKLIDEILKNYEVTEFSAFSANPKIEDAQEGVKQCLAANAQLIIAVGGGSALDTAKLIRHMIQEQGGRVLLHALPTTSGTGAEATHFAVVYIDGKKNSIEADDVLPDIAVVYPPFTYHNSAYLTACTGFDAVAQAIESYWAKGATEESKGYAVKALQKLWRQLPLLIKDLSDSSLRDAVSEGAYWAGRAINISKTTAPHAFSYAFTSHYDYPHGHAVALTFPFFMKLNGNQNLLTLLGLSTAQVHEQMEQYLSSIGLSLRISDSIDIEETLQEVNMQRLANNPVNVTPHIISMLVTYMRKQ